MPTYMVSTFYNPEHPMHVWDYDQSCFVTSHDQEADDEVELYLPPSMAHWHYSCPHELQAYEHLVLTVNQQKSSAVIKREFDNLTNEDILNQKSCCCQTC
eukprot:6475469-Prorocentrum_lima.AAC.1